MRNGHYMVTGRLSFTATFCDIDDGKEFVWPACSSCQMISMLSLMISVLPANSRAQTSGQLPDWITQCCAVLLSCFEGETGMVLHVDVTVGLTRCGILACSGSSAVQRCTVGVVLHLGATDEVV